MNTDIVALFRGQHLRGECWIMSIGGRLTSIILDNNTVVAGIDKRKEVVSNPIWGPVILEIKTSLNN